MKIKIRMERLISHQKFAPQLNYHVKVLFDAFSNNWTFRNDVTLSKGCNNASLTDRQVSIKHLAFTKSFTDSQSLLSLYSCRVTLPVYLPYLNIIYQYVYARGNLSSKRNCSCY